MSELGRWIAVYVLLLACSCSWRYPGTPAAHGTSGATNGAIADFVAFVAASDPELLVGLRADLSHATVRGIAGPRSFWIGSERGPHVLVVVHGMTIDAVTPGRTPVETGQRVSIDGEIKRLPGTAGDITVTDWRLPAPDAAKLEDQQIYIYATRVRVSAL